MRKITVAIFIIIALVVSTDAQALNKVRAYTALTGGGTGALDKTPIAELADGDIGLVVTPTNFYFYSFNAASTAAEASPWYIRPNDYATAGVWVAVNIGAPAIDVSPQDDGYIQFDPATASESDWWFGPNHDSQGDDDDPVELRQSATPGTSVRFRVNKDGSVTLYGTITLANSETIANSTDTQIAFASNGNEDLILDLDTATDNEVSFSSSTGVTKINFSALNLVTTGTIDGGIPVTTSTSATVTVSGMGGVYFNGDNDVIAFNLPADPVNKAFCFGNNAYANALTVNPDDSDYITMDGTTAAQGEAIVSSGNKKDWVCVVGVDSSNWRVTGSIGTWAQETP